MRWFFAPLILGLLVMPVRADDESRKTEVAAATSSAVNRLLDEVEAEPITGGVSVHLLIDKTASQPELLAVLQQAQQIGGPRWEDDQTCEIRLDINGDVVYRALVKIAADNPTTSPVPADVVRKNLSGWDGRVFSATGGCVDKLDAVHPPASSIAWKGAADQDVQAALQAARQDLVTRVLDSIGAVELPDNKHIGDALSNPPVASAMANWVGSRPLTRVDFREDSTVDVTLSITPAALCQEFRAVMSAHPDAAPLPADEAGWEKIAAQIAQAMASPVGHAALAPTTRPAVLLLPTLAPAWVARQLDAEGNGPVAQSKLLSARIAEDDAVGHLHDQVLALAISEKQSLRDLAGGDAEFSALIDRAVARNVHVYAVDYHADGTVHVRASINLRELWEEIRAHR